MTGNKAHSICVALRDLRQNQEERSLLVQEKGTVIHLVLCFPSTPNPLFSLHLSQTPLHSPVTIALGGIEPTFCTVTRGSCLAKGSLPPLIAGKCLLTLLSPGGHQTKKLLDTRRAGVWSSMKTGVCPRPGIQRWACKSLPHVDTGG